VPNEELLDVWRSKQAAARRLMRERSRNMSVLIEVAAQHPLRDGLFPNEEFRARLDRGRELFEAYHAAGRPVEIYVPGSRHTHEGTPDQVSLSAAGRTYLEQQGIPAISIRGEDLNQRYKGADGVYGSADECFVAAAYFRDGDFGVLGSVVSPAQMMRKTLHYIEFGVFPLNFTVPTLVSYHDYLDELFVKVPRVLAVDSTLQGDSEEARRLRNERRP
jgi:hypothetical protein